MDKIALALLEESECGPHLKRIGLYPHHGIILMLSSIYSKNSCGIGEFLDLLPLLPWAKQIGLDFIQLLPINDTGFDNSPYNPISTLALNPIYLSLSALPYVEENSLFSTEQKKLTNFTKSMRVNYGLVREKKINFLRAYADHYQTQIQEQPAYKAFIAENPWIYDYALFNTLAGEYKTEQWDLWPDSAKRLQGEKRAFAIKQYEPKLQFYLLMQFLCFEQLKQVKEEAQKHHIFLFGDLPFLVSRSSCDVWTFPDLFLMDYGVGSPPDRLTPERSKLGFPRL
jgi:4-alpha-glucanotransferase